MIYDLFAKQLSTKHGRFNLSKSKSFKIDSTFWYS